MAATLLTAGIACIIAAIAGGGLKAFGIEIPVLDSGRRQLALGAFGALLLASSPMMGGLREPSGGPTPSATGSAPSATGAATSTQEPASTASRTPEGCRPAWFGNPPPDRVRAMESGAAAIEVLTADKPKDRPVVVVVTERGQPVGAVSFNFYPSDGLFKLDEVVDAQCKPMEQFRNQSRGGDKRVLQDWDTLEMTLGGAMYTLRLGYKSGAIEGTLTRVG